MPRPKKLTAQAVSGTALELLDRMRDYVGAAGYRDDHGNLIDGRDFDPVLMLARISADPRVKASDRIAAAREAAKYVRPQLSTLQIAGDPERPILIRRSDGDVLDAKTMEPVSADQIKQIEDAGIETTNIVIRNFNEKQSNDGR
jgi:hypothetical protein